MPRKFNISFKESPSARAATKSNIAFGHFHRMAPYSEGKRNTWTYFKKGVSLPWLVLKGASQLVRGIKRS